MTFFFTALGKNTYLPPTHRRKDLIKKGQRSRALHKRMKLKLAGNLRPKFVFVFHSQPVPLANLR